MLVITSRAINLPGPKGDQETEPREEEHPAVDIDRIQTWDRSSFTIDGIDDRRLP